MKRKFNLIPRMVRRASNSYLCLLLVLESVKELNSLARMLASTIDWIKQGDFKKPCKKTSAKLVKIFYKNKAKRLKHTKAARDSLALCTMKVSLITDGYKELLEHFRVSVAARLNSTHFKKIDDYKKLDKDKRKWFDLL